MYTIRMHACTVVFSAYTRISQAKLIGRLSFHGELSDRAAGFGGLIIPI